MRLRYNRRPLWGLAAIRRPYTVLSGLPRAGRGPPESRRFARVEHTNIWEMPVESHLGKHLGKLDDDYRATRKSTVL